MAVNPRGGEGASKGSRYIPERLVGPGVIEQNGYLDRAKSKMHLRDITPVPNYVAVSDGLETTDVVSFALAVGPSTGGGRHPRSGDLMRIINDGTSEVTFTFRSTIPETPGPGTLLPGTAVMHIRPSSEIIVVIPPLALGYVLNQVPTAIEFTRDD